MLANSAPYDIGLSSESVLEGQPGGAVVGKLTTSDPDIGDAFTYSLVSGSGDVDNASFSVFGSELRASQSFEYATKNTYSIRVRSTDTGGLSIDEAFTIKVGADYSGQDLSGKDFRGYDFTGANFANANLSGTSLRGTYLINANLTNANLASADLMGGTNFTGADLTGVNFLDARFESNTVWPAGFNPLDKGMWGPGIDYSGQDLSGKDFRWHDFTGAIFTNANLSNVNLRGAYLINAIFANANLDGADLATAVLRGATYTAATIWPAGFDPVAAGAILVVQGQPPTQTILSATSVAENQPLGSTVGTFTAIDPDGGSFSYTLVSGDGDTDNASFTIVRGSLKTSAVFDYETKSSYSIRVRTTDSSGLSAETIFTIAVVNLGEASPNLAAGLLGHYKLDSDAVDGSGNGRDGSAINVVPAKDRFGKDNGALSFNGVDSYVTVPHDPAFNTLPLSISAWFQTTATGKVGIVGKYQAAGWNGYQLAMESPGAVWPWYVMSRGQDVIGNYEVAGDSNPAFRSSPLNDGQWHNVVFNVDASGGSLFVDGQLVATKEWRGEPITVTTNLPLFIGRYFGEEGGFFAGSIDDVRLYNRVLSPAEVGLLVSEAPSDIALSATSVIENQPAGTVVGTLSTTDADVSDSFTYTLVAGAGSDENGSFTIDGDTLKTNASFDYESKQTHSIRIRSTDTHGLSVERIFTLDVADIDESLSIDSLVAGIDSLISLGNPGPVSTTGAAWVPLVGGDADASRPSLFASVRHYGGGRVVAIGHDGIPANIEQLDNELFLKNVTRWLDARGTKQVLYTTGHSEWTTEARLSGLAERMATEGYTFTGLPGTVTADSLRQAGVLIIGNAWQPFSTSEIDAIEKFVAAGGGVWLLGLGWSWAQYHPTASMEDYPMTPIGAVFGVRWLTNVIVDPSDNINGSPIFTKFYPAIQPSEPPTDVVLSTWTFSENASNGTAVGTLSTTDADVGDSFTYSLVAGDGSDDNASFTIVGDKLVTAAQFDYETRIAHSVRVRSTDAAGLSTEKVFVLSVTDAGDVAKVTNVFIAGGDERFSRGIVMVSVVFDIPVVVDTTGGTPTLTLETGTVDRVIEYSRGSGTNTLEFSYTIRPGDTTDDLDYVSAAALALNGGMIRDRFGVDADLTLPEPGAPGSIGANNQIVIDTTAPTITLSDHLSDPVSGAVDVVSIDFSEPLYGFDHRDDIRLTRNGEPVSLEAVEWSGSGLNYALAPFRDSNALPGVYELRLSAATAGVIDVAGNSLVDDAVLSWVVGVPPTDIALSPTTVGENLPAGTVVGLLSTTDDDIGDSFTYALVSGDGSDDNASFTIRDGELLTAESFTAAAKGMYSIRIESTDAAGFTVSKAFTITVVGKPGAPTGVTGAPANGSVMLTWSAPVRDGGTPITNYLIEFRQDGHATWSTFAHAPSSATTIQVTGLSNYTRYVFRVSAVNVVGTGEASATSAIVMPLPLPGTPTSVTALPGDRRVALSWKAPPSSAGVPSVIDYVIQVSDNDGRTWTTFNDARSSATSATVTGLANGVSYVFRVQAVNSAGRGTVSMPSTAVSPRRTPGSPTGVMATPGDASATLSWIAPVTDGGVAITDYIVQYSTNGISWTSFKDAVSTTTSAKVTGLLNGATYMFRVAAVNVAGMGTPSAPSARVTPITAPGAPTAVSAAFANGEVRVSWVAPAAVGGAPLTDFVVQWSDNLGDTWTTVADGRSTALGATVTGLPYGSSYVFRVAAVNAAGQGAFSTGSAAVRLETAPGVPTGLTATAGNGQATLAWTAPASTGGTPITDYLIQYSRNNGTTWTTFADGVSSGRSATVTGLVNGVAYVFRIAAVNAAGASAYTAKSVPITPVSFTSARVTLGEVEFGSTQLGYAFRQDGVIRQVTTSGRNVSAGFVGTGWTMRAVWESGSGYEAFWADRTSRHAVWTLDASGRFLTTKVLTATQVAALEAELEFDLNGNGRSG